MANRENEKPIRPKRVFGCRPYLLKYKTGNEKQDNIFCGGIIIYAHKRDDIDKFLEKHPLDMEHQIEEYEWNVTMPNLTAWESLFHGVRCGMFFLDKNAEVESTDEMSERKFNFLYNHLPDHCGIGDCENLYHKMFEEDNPDIAKRLHSFPGFEDCIIDIERL